MKMVQKAYTLIELVMVVSLLVLVLLGGTAIFYRSFRSSGLSDVQANLNNSLRSLDEMIERSLRFGTIIRVVGGEGQKTRTDCLGAAGAGVVGNSLAVKDINGGSAVYSLLEDGTVSSNSGVIISNPEIVVTKLQFTWYCNAGVNDKINLLIEARSGDLGELGSTSVLNKDLILLNSGI